jgi:hypothetical protein
MDKNNTGTAIRVPVYPVLKGIRAAADVPALMVYPDLMTEDELIVYLRIPQISSAVNYRNVIEHLIRMRNLPCIHISRKRLYPLESVKVWVLSQVRKGVA